MAAAAEVGIQCLIAFALSVSSNDTGALVAHPQALIAVVVSMDILFFRHHFTERLMANVGIVLVFAAFGFLIFGRLGRRQE